MFILPEDAQRIADELKGITGRDVNFIDKDGMIIASTNAARIGQIHEGARRLIRDALPSVTIYDRDNVAGAQQGINLPVRVGGETVGVIGMTGAPEELAALGGAVQKMTELLVRRLQKQEQELEAGRARSIFYESWIFSDGADLGKLEARSALLDIDMQRPRAVAVAEFTPARETAEQLPEMRVAQAAEQMNRLLGAQAQNFCFRTQRRVVAILDCTGGDGARAAISRALKSVGDFYGVSYRCGLSAPCAAPEELPRKYSEAELAFAAARGREESTVCVYDDLSADFILQYIPDDAVRRLEERLLGACTAAERAEVMAAVRMYFRYEGDAARAARELYVHKNTVYHRIRRVQELTGYSLQRPSEAVLLYILVQRSK